MDTFYLSTIFGLIIVLTLFLVAHAFREQAIVSDACINSFQNNTVRYIECSQSNLEDLELYIKEIK